MKAAGVLPSKQDARSPLFDESNVYVEGYVETCAGGGQDVLDCVGQGNLF